MSSAGGGTRIGSLAVALVLAGCASATPTPTPAQSAPPPSASAAASATGPASPTAELPTPASPTPAETELSSPSAAPPSATPAAPSTLTIRWVNPSGASGLDDLHDLRASARHNSRFVIVGSKNMGSGDNADWGPAIWWSDDATTWHAATLPSGYEQGGCFIPALLLAVRASWQ